ncbi:unnamed protein product [Mesocestoides corti]|nr:unnamed protein product [Mesocestoides corti]
MTDDATIADTELLQFASNIGFGADIVLRYSVDDLPSGEQRNGNNMALTCHPSVCLGGTFDTLHHGHRVLLGVAALLAQRRLLVGITDSCLLKKKLLAPLIEAHSRRCSAVSTFLSDIDFPMERLEICRLTDPFGPPANDPDFQCIVASPESVPGCKKINEMRADNQLPELHIEVIEFVPRNDHAQLSLPQSFADSKISSSTLRMDLLGRSLLSRPLKPSRPKGRPWVVGLAGPAGSGKSTITQHLKNLAGDRLHVLHADQIGHQIYEPGTQTYTTLVEHFAPESIVESAPPHRIDRRKLASLVFNKAEQLERLNAVVWPRIASVIETQIIELQNDNRAELPIVVIDAALLFEAGWDQICDEVWTAYIPLDEAERRLVQRSNLSAEEALKRLCFQATGVLESIGGGSADWWTPCQRGSTVGPIARSNVVFCSVWEVDYTRKQVKRAWEDLIQRISELQ